MPRPIYFFIGVSTLSSARALDKFLHIGRGPSVFLSQCGNYLLRLLIFLVQSRHVLDPLIKRSLHFIEGGRRSFRRLRFFFNLSGKSHCLLDEVRIGFGVADFEVSGDVGAVDSFFERSKTFRSVRFTKKIEERSHGGLWSIHEVGILQPEKDARTIGPFSQKTAAHSAAPVVVSFFFLGHL